VCCIGNRIHVYIHIGSPSPAKSRKNGTQSYPSTYTSRAVEILYIYARMQGVLQCVAVCCSVLQCVAVEI